MTAERCLAGTGRWRKEERLQGFGQVEVPGAAKVAGELCYKHPLPREEACFRKLLLGGVVC